MNHFSPQEQLTGFAEVMLIATRNTMAKLGELTLGAIDKKLDWQGEDSPEDQAVKSTIWDRQ